MLRTVTDLFIQEKLDEKSITTPDDNQFTRLNATESGHIQQPGSHWPREEDEFSHYSSILKRRKWTIVSPLFIIVPVMILSIFLEKPTYKATTTLSIENDNPRVLDIKDVIIPDQSPDFYLTEYELIKSRGIAEEVVDVLELDKEIQEDDIYIVRVINTIGGFLRQMMGTIKQKMHHRPVPPKDSSRMRPTLNPVAQHRQKVIQQFQKSRQVRPREGTKLVDITIIGIDPYAVAQQANTLAEIYMRKNLEKKLDVSRKAISRLTKKVTDLKEKMYASQLVLQKFGESKNLISFDADKKDNIFLKDLTELHTIYNKSISDRLALESQINKLKELSSSNKLIDALPENLNNSSVYALKKTYLELQVQHMILSKIYKSNHPKIDRIKSQINDIKNSINSEIQKMINELQTEYNLLINKENTIEKLIFKKDREAININNDTLSYIILKSELEKDRKLYIDASKRLEEISLTQELITNNINIIERAEVPVHPISSGSVKKILLSIIISLSLGIIFSSIKEYFDNRFKKIEEIENSLSVPFLGVIPHYDTKKQGPYQPVMLHASESIVAETYRMLRTRIQSSPQKIKTLLITSTVPGEGKSTTSANLGIAFALSGLHVLLVDVDLRRPSLHHYFNLKENIGLSDILVNGTAWNTVIQTTKVENLQVLPVGIRSQNPSDLLSLKPMKTLIENLRSAFDLVIFDSPRVLSLSDTEILAPEMDGVLLVHSPSMGDKDMTMVARGFLNKVRANLIGIIFNNISKKEEKDYAYQRYYTYYYVSKTLLER